MSKTEFEIFTDNFWVVFKKVISYSISALRCVRNNNPIFFSQNDDKEIVEKIPKFLQFKCEPGNVPYQQLCIFSVICMERTKTINSEYLKDLLIAYKEVIKFARNKADAIEKFVCLEYFVEISNFSLVADTNMVNEMTDIVFEKLDRKTSWTENDRMMYKRLLIVLVQMESSLDGTSPKFTLTKKALSLFPSDKVKTEEMKADWPEYFLSLLEVCTLCHSESADRVSLELQQKIR